MDPMELDQAIESLHSKYSKKMVSAFSVILTALLLLFAVTRRVFMG